MRFGQHMIVLPLGCRSVLRGFFVAMLLASVSMLAMGCSGSREPLTCSEESAEFIAALTSHLEAWEKVEENTRGSGGDRLAQGIDDMCDIRAQVADLSPPECSLSVKVAVLRFMDLAIEAQTMVLTDDCHTCIEETEYQAKAAKEIALEAVSILVDAP